jgi:predicted nucleic acid-binding protein
MGWVLLRQGTSQAYAAMILVDTSVIVAWLDSAHEQHAACKRALEHYAGADTLAVSSVTYAELAAGARTREGVDEDLKVFERINLDFDSAWRAGVAFRKYRPQKGENPVLPDFLIRAQAATGNLPHLTNDHRRTRPWPDVDFIFASHKPPNE